MADAEAENLTCAAFLALSESEQSLFVIGVANGRGMTAGLYLAYAGAAMDMAGTAAERDAIKSSFETIQPMVMPLLEIDATSLLNGIRAVCKRPELQDKFVIDALASVHLDVAKAIRKHREENS